MEGTRDGELHFPEHLVAVHPTEDEEQDKAVAEGEEEVVVIAEEGLETITYGVDNATEVDAFANQNLRTSIPPSMKRLASLDILRGFDLFLLLFVGPVVSSLAAVSDAEWTSTLAYHFDHAAWDGLRMWDLVMPLFMFMAGVSMPFALRKEVKGAGIWRRILKRVILLFILGMVVQGGLLTFNWERFTLYTNTLQAIGFGYGIAAVLLLTLSVRMQVLTTL